MSKFRIKYLQFKRLIDILLLKFRLLRVDEALLILQDCAYDYRCHEAINENVNDTYKAVYHEFMSELLNADLLDEKSEIYAYFESCLEVNEIEQIEIKKQLARVYTRESETE